MQHEHTEHVAASPDAVYAAISDVANLPRFVPQMIGVRPTGEDWVQVDARYEGHEQHGEASFHVDAADRRIEHCRSGESRPARCPHLRTQ